ncbi:MFS transporter [Paraburkholderia sp. EG287B]|uniref:MFS transporter n=1 Tax=Paraburkholderia sp. EG287B TaxID=3237010 RepID=UPI0034D32952
MASPASDRKPGENTATWALAVAQLVAWGTVYYAFSLFVVPMEFELGWSRASTDAALSLGLLVSGLAAYPVGRWIDHGHGRVVLTAGSLLASVMLVLWSQAGSLVTLFAAWVGLGIAMAATLYDPVFAILTRNYPHSFRTKITLVTLVAGFASTVFIPLTQGLIDYQGWRHALLSLSVINCCVCLPIHLTALRDRATTTLGKGTVKAENDESVRRALRTPVFWGLAVCFTAYYATFAALTFHLVPLMVERHVAQPVILATMAVIGPAQVFVRTLWFTVGRNVSPKIVGLTVTSAFPASVVILLVAGTSPAALILFALIYVGANGMMTILRGTIVQNILWTEGYGAVSGLLSMPSNIAKGIAPISAAAIWTMTGNYLPVEWAVLGVSLVSACAFMFVVRSTADASRKVAARERSTL